MEIWPTSIVVPKGYRIGLSVRGRDYVYPGFEQPAYLLLPVIPAGGQ